MPDIRRSATEARLLALLTSTPGQEFHTRELVRRIDGSPRPVQLALEKLLRQGLVVFGALVLREHARSGRGSNNLFKPSCLRLWRARESG